MLDVKVMCIYSDGNQLCCVCVYIYIFDNLEKVTRKVATASNQIPCRINKLVLHRC